MAELTLDLQQILVKFFTAKGHFDGFLHRVEKQRLESALKEVLDIYARDKNSSTLREFITLAMADYRWKMGQKLGFNGWQTVKGTRVWAEVKPKNIERGSGNKFSGNGNFTDFTPERLAEYKKQRLNVLVSCFVDGELALIMEFPFNCPQFTDRLGATLEKRFPGGKRPSGQFLRSAQFNWRHYKDCNVRLVFLNHELLEADAQVFTRDFRQWALSLAAGNSK